MSQHYFDVFINRIGEEAYLYADLVLRKNGLSRTTEEEK